MAGKADPGLLPEDLRTRSGPAARRRRREGRVRRTREGSRRQVAGRNRRRLHQDRRREHGERHQEDFRAARLRRDALRAQLLRRRGRPACLPRRRRARHDHRADPSVLVAALGLRHGPRRHPRDAPAGDRGSVRQQVARHAEQDRQAPLRRRERRGRRTGRAEERPEGPCARAHPLRRHRHCAGGEGRIAWPHEVRLREGAQGAVRLHRPQEGPRHRSRVGRSRRRRREIPREEGHDDARETPLAGAAHEVLLRRQVAQRHRLHPRPARGGPQGERPRHRHRAAPDRGGRARLAGRHHGEEPPRAQRAS